MRPIAFILSLETIVMLNTIRKAIKYLAKPRQFMYLNGFIGRGLAICLLCDL